MPGKGKKTLKESLEDELVPICDERSDLQVVAVADGALGDWPWLEKTGTGQVAEQSWSVRTGAPFLVGGDAVSPHTARDTRAPPSAPPDGRRAPSAPDWETRLY